MQNTELQHFLFLDKISHRLLLMKPSRGFDLTLPLEEIETYRLVSSNTVPQVTPLSATFHFADGFKASPCEDNETNRLLLLKKKVETLLLIKTNVNLLEAEIKRSFSEEAQETAPVEKQNRELYKRFLSEERAIALKLVNDFLLDASRRIAEASSIPAVENAYKHLMENVNLGVYSATNQERKNLRQ